MGSTTTILAAACVVLSLIFIVIAALGKRETEGQQTLLRVTREAGRTRVLDTRSGTRARLIDPVLALMLRLGKRLTPGERLAKLESRLDHAGFPEGWDINRVLAIKALALVVGSALGLFISTTLFPKLFIFLVPLFALGGFYIPDYFLTKAAEKRASQMQRSMADFVDMLNLTLAAGIGFDSALKLVSQNTDGPLSEEFGRVVQEITMGKSRAEALHALAERTGDDDLRRFCATCVQAEKRGTPFGDILALQSRELRIKRRQIAEEKAQKVPVKILFPMMMFVLPVLMLVVMGPAVVQIAQNYK